MPTWRKFHVKTTDSLDLHDMPDDFTRLMWCLLPLKSCREGRGIDLPQWIASQLFPLRSDVTPEQVESAMRWYHDQGMIRRYKANGRPYYQIKNWHTYQGNTSKEAESPFPDPEVDSEIDIDVDSDGCKPTSPRVSPELIQSKSGARGSGQENYSLPPIPTIIASPAMMTKWGEWCQYQQDKGHPLVYRTAKAQQGSFAEWGEARSIAAMDFSIAQGYKGLIEPKGTGNSKRPTTLDNSMAAIKRALGD